MELNLQKRPTATLLPRTSIDNGITMNTTHKIPNLLSKKKYFAIFLNILAAPAIAGSVLTDLEINRERGWAAPNQDGTSIFAKQYSASDNMGFVGAAEVIISTRPAPYIVASARAYSPSCACGFNSIGRLQYDIDVLGTANTYIPVNFRGAYDLSGRVKNLATTTANFSFGNAVFSLAGVATWIDQTQGIQVEEKITTDSQHSGYFSGSSSFLTNALGHATATVYMVTQAGAGGDGSPLTTTTQNSRAFLDPEFYIDPIWLLANPGASLTLPDGVGNAVYQPVPELETYTLMLAGMGMMALVARRRKQVIDNA